MDRRAGFSSSSCPVESQRQIPYGAWVTRERKFFSERRNPSCAARNAPLNQQIRTASTTKSASLSMVERNCAGDCSAEKEKYALTVSANEVATRPGFQPPYQALTITATANTARRLSAILGRSSAGISARVVLSTATP